jgi:hypothetical protein
MKTAQTIAKTAPFLLLIIKHHAYNSKDTFLFLSWVHWYGSVSGPTVGEMFCAKSTYFYSHW